jgi:hypothetical protein
MRKSFAMRSLYIVSSLIVLLALVLAGCAPSAAPSEGSEAAEPAAEAKVYRIAFSVPAMSFPFFVHMEKQVPRGRSGEDRQHRDRSRSTARTTRPSRWLTWKV